MLEVKLYLLIVVANAAPLIAGILLSETYNCPIDSGKYFFDKKPIFGPSKTIRGIFASLIMTALVGLSLGINMQACILISVFAMLGDLLSSFIKRRLGLASGKFVLVLDQVPESLLPLLVVQQMTGLQLNSIAVVMVLFLVTDVILSRLLYIFKKSKNSS